MKISVKKPLLIKKHVMIMLLCLFSNTVLIAQKDSRSFIVYSKSVYEAKALMKIGQYDSSHYLYQVAFKHSSNPFIHDLLDAALVSRKANQPHEVAKRYFEKAVAAGLSKVRLKKNLRDRALYPAVLRREILEGYDAINARYVEEVMVSEKATVARIIKRDRRSRNFWGLLTSFDKKDLINYKEITKLCEAGAWPSPHTMGQFKKKNKYDVTGRITLVFLHFNPQQIAKLQPYLSEALELGLIMPDEYARIMDYTSIKLTLKQTYGTYVKTAGKRPSFLTILNPEQVNERRAEIGLKPIEQYAEDRGVSWESY